MLPTSRYRIQQRNTQTNKHSNTNPNKHRNKQTKTNKHTDTNKHINKQTDAGKLGRWLRCILKLPSAWSDSVPPVAWDPRAVQGAESFSVAGWSKVETIWRQKLWWLEISAKRFFFCSSSGWSVLILPVTLDLRARKGPHFCKLASQELWGVEM